jgi:hypothetical protein
MGGQGQLSLGLVSFWGVEESESSEVSLSSSSFWGGVSVRNRSFWMDCILRFHYPCLQNSGSEFPIIAIAPSNRTLPESIHITSSKLTSTSEGWFLDNRPTR